MFEYQDDPGPADMALCILIDSPSLSVMGLNGGTACVVIITLDHYWKVVHPIHHRKNYRPWMLRVGLFLPWLNGLASHFLPAVGTTRIVNGICVPVSFWPSEIMDKVCQSV